MNNAYLSENQVCEALDSLRFIQEIEEKEKTDAFPFRPVRVSTPSFLSDNDLNACLLEAEQILFGDDSVQSILREAGIEEKVDEESTAWLDDLHAELLAQDTQRSNLMPSKPVKVVEMETANEFLNPVNIFEREKIDREIDSMLTPTIKKPKPSLTEQDLNMLRSAKKSRDKDWSTFLKEEAIFRQRMERYETNMKAVTRRLSKKYPNNGSSTRQLRIKRLKN